MVVVPHLAKLRAAIVERAGTSFRLVVARATASDEGHVAEAIGQRGLDVGERVGRGVGGFDVGGSEPGPGWEGLVVGNGCFKVVKEVCVLGSLGTLLITNC